MAAFTVPYGHVPQSQHSFSGRECVVGRAVFLQHHESSCGRSSSLVITEDMVILYDGASEAGVLHALTRK